MNTTGTGAKSFETAFGTEITPEEGDFDGLGHVNNIVYLRWAQDIAVRHWSLVAPPDLRARVLFVVLRHEIDYRHPILPGDGTQVRTWLGKAAGPRFDRHVDIRRQGANRFSAKVRTTWCMLNTDTRRPQRIGQEIFSVFGLEPNDFD